MTGLQSPTASITRGRQHERRIAAPVTADREANPSGGVIESDQGVEDTPEAQEAIALRVPALPSVEEQDRRVLTRVPYAPW
eukprot:4510920-Pyramimonas_sp.AAC.1